MCRTVYSRLLKYFRKHHLFSEGGYFIIFDSWSCEEWEIKKSVASRSIAVDLIKQVCPKRKNVVSHYVKSYLTIFRGNSCK